MTKTEIAPLKMRALMTLPARRDRAEIPRGAEFEAGAQERLDLLQSGRATDAEQGKTIAQSAAAKDAKS